MSHAIEVQNLTKIYPSPGKGAGFLAVDQINFTIKQGEIFGFLGPNGAGKSTTQRMLTTLLTPTEGQILILGHDLADDAYPAKRQGMKRKLSIAMAIIHKPALLFLDEPTPGLDVQSARTIRTLIRQLSAEGTTVFMTTHQIEEANQLCDRVAIINHGKIAVIDTPEKLKQTFQQVQSVEIAFTQSPEGLEDKFTTLPEVSTVLKIGDKWRLYTDSPPDLLPHLIKFSEKENLDIVSLNTLAPSLEDVFLQITGQQVGSVSEEPSPQKADMRRKKGKQS
jgi:ABC-type multidrug transport system ATPase subunit